MGVNNLNELSNSPPQWMQKHPCKSCSQGYGICATAANNSLKCCRNCEHPTRWEPNPWTAEDLTEMHGP